MAQLFKVPRTLRPVGSALVFNLESPAAGPPIVIGVMPVMRRANFEGRTTSQSRWRRPFFSLGASTSLISIIDAMRCQGLGCFLGRPICGQCELLLEVES